MNIETLSQFFLWSSIINICISFVVFLVIIIGKGFVYKIHSQLFKISEEKAAETIYASMISYKTIIFVFNIIPYITIQIIK
jgi:hypothetical protein